MSNNSEVVDLRRLQERFFSGEENVRGVHLLRQESDDGYELWSVGSSLGAREIIESEFEDMKDKVSIREQMPRFVFAAGSVVVGDSVEKLSPQGARLEKGKVTGLVRGRRLGQEALITANHVTQPKAGNQQVKIVPLNCPLWLMDKYSKPDRWRAYYSDFRLCEVAGFSVDEMRELAVLGHLTPDSLGFELLNVNRRGKAQYRGVVDNILVVDSETSQEFHFRKQLCFKGQEGEAYRFAVFGDSGALVTSQEGDAVGMFIAVQNPGSWYLVTPMSAIFDEIDFMQPKLLA